MGIKIKYDDVCDIKSDNGTVIQGEVLDFVPQKYLRVSVQRSVTVTLNYVAKHDHYVGGMAGIELITNGPKETMTYEGRRRK